MAIDFSKNVSDLFSGRKRIRLLPTLGVTVLVTLAVAVPLILRAVDAKNNPAQTQVVLAPADTDLVLVDSVDSDPEPLDLSTVSGSILISLREEAATAVSFNLFAAGAQAAVVESQDPEGPQFDLFVTDRGTGAPFDSTVLANGDYELFVTIRTPNEDRRTAVSFKVENP